MAAETRAARACSFSSCVASASDAAAARRRGGGAGGGEETATSDGRLAAAERALARGLAVDEEHLAVAGLAHGDAEVLARGVAQHLRVGVGRARRPRALLALAREEGDRRDEPRATAEAETPQLKLVSAVRARVRDEVVAG